MGALRKPVETEFETEIYVLPYNQPRPSKAKGESERSFWAALGENELFDQIVFVLKGFAVTAGLGLALWALSAAYEQKNELGIDLVPGVSFSQYLVRP